MADARRCRDASTFGCVCLIASNLLRNELGFCKLCFLKQRHEKISFIVYATISDFVRAMISLVL